MHIREITNSCLTEACSVVLPSANVAASPSKSEPLRMAAIIGFAGDQVRGTISLAVDIDAIDLIREQLGALKTQKEDSLGEMANLLAGHIKRGLAHYGEVVTITPPIVVRGVTIEVCSAEHVTRVACNRDLDRGRMSVWLDYDAPTDLDLSETADSDNADAGEMNFRFERNDNGDRRRALLTATSERQNRRHTCWQSE